MKKPYLLLVVSGLLTALFFPANLEAKKHHKEVETIIDSIDQNSIVVKEGKASRTYAINKFTTFYCYGQLAKVSDLKPGMRVEVSAGTDPAVAERISASEAAVK